MGRVHLVSSQFEVSSFVGIAGKGGRGSFAKGGEKRNRRRRDKKPPFYLMVSLVSFDALVQMKFKYIFVNVVL